MKGKKWVCFGGVGFLLLIFFCFVVVFMVPDKAIYIVKHFSYKFSVSKQSNHKSSF